MSRICCNRKIRPDNIYVLEPQGGYYRKLLIGVCTHCSSLIVELQSIDLAGNVSFQVFKRHKAEKILSQLKSSIIADYITSNKHGSKSNAGFRYGLNKEIKNNKGELKEIRRYAVDFNGKKELLNL